jgi:hypothetical protein
MANTMYTLHVICPHCTQHTAITEGPVSARDPVLFTCIPKRGGCGGQALVEPPQTDNFPNLEHVYVTPEPLTKRQAQRLTTQDEAP